MSFVTFDNCYTLFEAREIRKVSGDVVIDLETGKVAQSHEWLWEWELLDETCYSQKAIKGKVLGRLNVKPCDSDELV